MTVFIIGLGNIGEVRIQRLTWKYPGKTSPLKVTELVRKSRL